MGQTRTLVLVAGTVLCSAGSAFAQNAYQNEVVADASARVSLMQGAAGAGGASYGEHGFSISDATGDNRLTIGGALQFRHNWTFRDDSTVGDTNDFANGFQTPLTRLRASGTIGSRDHGYKIQLVVDSSGFVTTDDAYATHDFGNGWTFRGGQFNLPFSREVSQGPEVHLGSDFSIASQVFGQGYSQGVMVGYQSDQFRLAGAVSDGFSTANTPFSGDGAGIFTPGSDLEADTSITLRGEGLVLGSNWSTFNDYTSWRSTQGDNVLVGGAVHWQSGGESAAPTDDVDLFALTVDGSWEGPGYNVTGAFYYNTIDAAGSNFDNIGFMAQGGFFFADQVEGFARWDGLFLDDTLVSEDTMNFLTVGINYYLFPDSNASKFTGQVAFSFDADADLWGPTGILGSSQENGFLGDTSDGEIAIQLQFQNVF